MGVPNTTTFKMRDVCLELQMTGYTSPPTMSLTNFFVDAPTISFDPSYKGGEICLLNYRNFCLISGCTVTYGALGLANDGTNIWATNFTQDRVSKIEPDGTVTTYIVGNAPMGIAYDGTNMWVTNVLDSSVSKVTPAGAVTTYSGLGDRPWGIAYDGTNMWTANCNGNNVSKITPAGAVTNYGSTGVGAMAIAYDGTNMWTANYGGGSVSKVTPAGSITTYTGMGARNPSSIVYDGTNMWTSNHSITYKGVSKVTPAGSVTNYDNVSTNHDSPYQLTFDGTYLWVADFGGTTGEYITRVDLSGVGKDFKIPTTGPRPIMYWNNYIWTIGQNTACLLRIGAT